MNDWDIIRIQGEMVDCDTDFALSVTCRNGRRHAVRCPMQLITAAVSPALPIGRMVEALHQWTLAQQRQQLQETAK